MKELQELTESVMKGDRVNAKRLSQALLDAGMKPLDVVEKGLVPAMATVGERFKRNEIFVPEMLIAARAMKEAMSLLEPLLVKAGIKPRFTAVVGTVQGDLHDIGKNLVCMMLKGANIAVVDVGVNAAPDKFVASVKEHKADILALSALLTTTMPAMKTTIEAVRKDGVPVKIMIGGAPVTQQYADEIGADGYAPDAASAVDKATALLGA